METPQINLQLHETETVSDTQTEAAARVSSSVGLADFWRHSLLLCDKNKYPDMTAAPLNPPSSIRLRGHRYK